MQQFTANQIGADRWFLRFAGVWPGSAVSVMACGLRERFAIHPQVP